MSLRRSAGLYAGRRLAEAYPDLEARGLRFRQRPSKVHAIDATDVDKTLRYIGRLIDFSGRRSVVVVGCGQRPVIVRRLVELGHQTTGIEPVDAYVREAAAYLGAEGVVVQGAAERIPLPDGSQDLVLAESVLEHVDSVSASLAEIYRVTAPGGIAYIRTTSKLTLSLSGKNGEFRVPFFNWLPPVLKESFVHHHLHYDPTLADYSSRPAVHWFSYSELCRAGREAGFARFYSLFDVLETSDASIASNRLRRTILDACKYHPIVRALALTQVGGDVFMYKRPLARG